jgi:cytochrome c55X
MANLVPPRSACGACPPGGASPDTKDPRDLSCLASGRAAVPGAACQARRRTGRAGSEAAAWVRLAGWTIGLVFVAVSAAAADPPASRQRELVRIVRQDCGSCHGMRLTGGLGPALTREVMADKPLDSMIATIFNGRPGTPMPPWRAMLSEADARWIAERLAAGFPEEVR